MDAVGARRRAVAPRASGPPRTASPPRSQISCTPLKTGPYSTPSPARRSYIAAAASGLASAGGHTPPVAAAAWRPSARAALPGVVPLERSTPLAWRVHTRSPPALPRAPVCSCGCERPPARGVGTCQRDLQRHPLVLGEHQRGFHHQLLHRVTAGQMGNVQRDVHKRGAGNQHRAHHHVRGQPSLAVGRDATREQPPLPVGNAERCAEQRVAHCVEAGRGEVRGPRGAGVEPVAAALEGVAREPPRPRAAPLEGPAPQSRRATLARTHSCGPSAPVKRARPRGLAHGAASAVCRPRPSAPREAPRPPSRVPGRHSCAIALSTPSGPSSSRLSTPAPRRASGPRRRSARARARGAPSTRDRTPVRSDDLLAGEVRDDRDPRRREARGRAATRSSSASIPSIRGEWNAWLTRSRRGLATLPLEDARER